MKSSSWAERFVENIQQRHRKTGKAGAVRGRPPHSDITKKKKTHKKNTNSLSMEESHVSPNLPRSKLKGHTYFLALVIH